MKRKPNKTAAATAIRVATFKTISKKQSEIYAFEERRSKTHSTPRLGRGWLP